MTQEITRRTDQKIHPVVYLPVEVKSAELTWKLDLAKALIDRGFHVVIGRIWQLQSRNLNGWPPGVFVFNNLNLTEAYPMNMAEGRGHVVCAFNEGSPTPQTSLRCHTIFPPENSEVTADTILSIYRAHKSEETLELADIMNRQSFATIGEFYRLKFPDTPEDEINELLGYGYWALTIEPGAFFVSTPEGADKAVLAKQRKEADSKRPLQTTRIGSEEIKVRTRQAMARGIPSIMKMLDVCKGQTAIICGGGPSLTDNLGLLRRLSHRPGYKIIATNKTHDFLVKRKFPVWGVVLLDPMPHVAEYVKRATSGTKVFIAGQCHEDTFKSVAHADCYLWHAGDNQDEDMLPLSVLKAEYPEHPWKIIGGGNTGGLRAIYVSQPLGFKKIRLIGFDSSMRDGKLYAYDKAHPKDCQEGPADLYINGHHQTFYTNEHMARQVENFESMIKQIYLWNTTGAWSGLDEMLVYGDGMLPCLAAAYGLHADPEMNKKWAKQT
jgi:hypothetical protein